ncbi:hypothetical protein [Actinopolyspora mortivallis]|uniref:sunset domain-containing protein n=1 Tax=Actinopolyspora mortivallis TaxID=33906 RepID=UPI00036FADD3|nr:hypothetical protein [Actinopolyspora mortivallis]
MTWLFTQVWLWSFAGFLCGVLLTWMLFVRPAHQRLRALWERLSTVDRSPPETAAERTSELPEQDTDTAVWDLLDTDEEGTVPAADRPFRTSAPAAQPEEWPTERVLSEEQTPDPRVRGSWMRRAQRDFGGEVFAAEGADTRPGVTAVDDTDSVAGASAPGQGDELTPEHHRETSSRQRRDDLPEEPWAEAPSAPAELAPGAEFSAPGENTWFTATDFDMYDTDSPDRRQYESAETDTSPRWSERPSGAESPAGQPSSATRPAGEEPQTEGELTGRLRSLFEPLSTPGISPDQQGAELPPTTSEQREHPVDEPEKDGTPGDGSANASGEGTAGAELPRRVPGSSTRPGTPPRARPVMAGRVPHSEEAPARTSRESTEEGGNPPQEWYPDEEHPERQRPDESYTVKGQFASRQYHTPDSPYFEHVVAEVWFRTAADAEQAGFEAWDGQRRG